MIGRVTLLIAICFASQAARAEIIEVPLPELQGSYTFPNLRGGDDAGVQERQESFDLGSPVTHVNAASIRWVGTIRTEYNSQVYGGILTRLDPPTRGWEARIPFETILYQGPESHFQFTTPLKGYVPNANLSWEFLYDGVADIELGLYQIIYSTTASFAPPTVHIDEATLILDVIFATTPVEPSTWGRVKALYRQE